MYSGTEQTRQARDKEADMTKATTKIAPIDLHAINIESEACLLRQCFIGATLGKATMPRPGRLTARGKVRFLNKNGCDSERAEARSLMEPGTICTVRCVEVEDWRSEVCFEEYPHRWFNTVMFENVEDG